MNRQENSKMQRWMLVIYFVFCFYYFGVVMMTYFVSYPQLQKVSRNIFDYMQLFNDKMLLFCYIPAALMIISHVIVINFCSKVFSRALLWSSFAFALLSVTTTFFAIIPIHKELPSLGLSAELSSRMLMYAMYLQLIPAAIQVIIAFVLLNKYLNDTRLIGRVLFIAVFFLTLYSMGTLFIESLVGYPMWLLIDPSDWLSTREAVGLNIPAFIWIFLIPVYLPLILLIPMYWIRPNGISKYPVLIIFFSLLWVFVITAIYFVPEIQLKLTVGYSKALIEDLNKYDFPLRGIPDLIYMSAVCYMFLTIKKLKTS
ncbi:MAG: hypothetical protein WCI54_12660 [Bacteroidia bacterium]